LVASIERIPWLDGGSHRAYRHADNGACFLISSHETLQAAKQAAERFLGPEQPER
jgi:hypothetical protein